MLRADAPKGEADKREITRLVAAVAVYIALLTGLSLHGVVMPDMTTTSSLGNEIKDMPEVTDYHRRDRGWFCRDGAALPDRRSSNQEETEDHGSA